MMKVLVTGSGLLGTAVRKVSDQYKDYNFIFPERYRWDLTQPKKVEWLINAYKPDIIIHTSAKVGGIKLNTQKPETMFYDNMMMTCNVIHYAALAGVKKVVAFGSTCAFDNGLSEITELSAQEGQPYISNYAYGYAKRMTEINLRSAKDQYGMDYAYYVPVSMYGPGDQFNLDNAHVIPSLIHKCRIAMDNDEPLKIWGDGSPLRELLFAEDMAKIILLLLDKEVGTCIVGSGEEVSIRTMVDEITEAMGFSGCLVWETDRPNGQLRRAPSRTNKLRSLLGDFKFTPFVDGLKQTVGWFQENYPDVRE